MHPYLFVAQSSTVARVGPAGTGRVGTLFAHNPGAAGAYVKLYDGGATPNVATDAPAASLWVPATTALAFELAAGFGGGCWIAVATQAGAGATAPASAFVITVVHGVG